MTIRAILKWQNQDSTSDLNLRFAALFTRGIIEGGIFSTVPGSLEINVLPFQTMSNDGMLVVNDSIESLSIPLDQTNIIALHAKHQIGDEPITDLVVMEASVFDSLIERDDYIAYGAVTVSSPATEVNIANINYVRREEQDRRTRSKLRGHVTDVSQLPVDPNFNWPGDMYVVAAGSGGASNIYAWDDLAWVNITATAAIASDLALHRVNYFTDEVHLTDDQSDAAIGSYGLPSILNTYVTSADPRVPTQNENDALLGSDGPPSITNKYITAEYPLAQPTTLYFPGPPGASILVAAASGPVYVGKAGVGSANKYFTFLNATLEQGYVSSTYLSAIVTGVFKDSLLTNQLDPSTDINVDANGFHTGDLFLSVSNFIDTASRLIYGKLQYLNQVDKGFSVLANPADAMISGDSIEKIVNIKGRDFNDPVPVPEQNINLRSDLNGLNGYIGSVLETNVIAANEDFIRLAGDPILGVYFVKNIGVDDVITFDNGGLTGFTYDNLTGLVQYSVAVNLSAVRVGDIFVDGAGDIYLVTAVNDGSDNLNIQDISTGLFPITITTSVGTSLDGSTRVNNNPRDLLLSEMKFSNCAELTPIRNLVRKTNEFSVPDSQVAYGIIRHDNRFDPRIVFYGAWENYTSNTGETYVRNVGGNGKFIVTGFFTELVLVLRRRNNGPALSVSIDGQAPTIISTSALTTVNANVSSAEGPKYHTLLLASGLPANIPSTVTVEIASATLGSLDIFGIMNVRTDAANSALLESGRAFESASIVGRNNLSNVPLIQLDGYERGGRAIYAIDENSFVLAVNDLLDMDANGEPNGTVSGNQFSITAGASKLVNYRVNDIIILYTVTKTEMHRIANITGTIITLSQASTISGVATYMLHVCRTDSNIPLIDEEDFAVSYHLPDDFINGTSTDLAPAPSGDRFVLQSDGVTLVSGENLAVTSSDIIGVSKAIELQVGSKLNFTVLATRLDLLIVSDASAIVWISIDGSPFVTTTFTFSGGSAARRTIFSNARYQTHDIVLNCISGSLAVSEMFLYAPKKPEFAGFPNEVVDLNRIARYIPSFSTFAAAPNVYPSGAVFRDSYHFMTYINGTGAGDDWQITHDFSKNIKTGIYVYADRVGAYIEFYVMGEGFELQYIKGDGHGTFVVEVDDVALELTGATIVGNYTSNSVNALDGSYGRSNIGAYGLAYGYHKIVARILTGKMAFVGYYQCNVDGYASMGLNREGVYTSVVDTRNFIPLPPATPLETGVQEEIGRDRSGKIDIIVGNTSIVVNLLQPFPDTNYMVVASMTNFVDSEPEYQPLVVTAQTSLGFTLSWNSEMPTGNYVLHYFARSI